MTAKDCGSVAVDLSMVHRSRATTNLAFLHSSLVLADHASPTPAAASASLRVLRAALADALNLTVPQLLELSASNAANNPDQLPIAFPHAKPALVAQPQASVAFAGPMKAWPVDFSGFTTAEQIFDRIEVLQPRVLRGHEDVCWASWEIERLHALLVGP